MNLNWVTLNVSNLEKSLFFYTKLLNLDIAAKLGSQEHQIVMLGKADETKIELIYESDSKIDNPGNGVSIGLEADDLDQLIGVLQENGYKTVGPISPNSKIRFFFVQDPNGYTVQLVKQK
jgi:lactoylglutathione lyase